jgi:hypothetical protein
MKLRKSVLTVAVLAAALASAPVWAGGGKYGPPGGRYNGHYSGNYGGHYGGYRYYPKYNHHHHYSGTDVFVGATLGFVLGAALAPPVYYAPPPPRVVYREPATVVYREPPRDEGCLQTREYTTTVTIDGRQVEAWGTRCLRPDGTWSYGPARSE